MKRAGFFVKKPFKVSSILKKYKANNLNLSEAENKIYYSNFKNAFKDFALDERRFDIMKKILTGFISAEIIARHIGFDAKEVEPTEPILITVIKDDLERVKLFLSHYRKLGVGNFVILDNGSTDGTYEFLLEQSDVNLYQCFETYETYLKEAWVNRLISTCGRNRWYIIVDSDELLDFYLDEEHKINELIAILQNKGFNRARGILIDMYSSVNLFETDCAYNEIPNEFCYFDAEGYYKCNSAKGFPSHWAGGPRQRILAANGIWISKCPLIYYNDEALVVNSHFQFPIKENEQAPYYCFIRHFKYLKSDYKAFIKRAEYGNFDGNSKFYKSALDLYKQQEAINFMYDKSKKYENSEAIGLIDIVEKISWN